MIISEYLITHIFYIIQACPDICETEANFVLNALCKKVEKKPAKMKKEKLKKPATNINVAKNQILNGKMSDSDSDDGESSKKVITDEVELIALCSSVLELLPHLQMSFVKECLKYYNYNTEKVIQVLLEDDLPQHLRSLQTGSHGDISSCTSSTDQQSSSYGDSISAGSSTCMPAGSSSSSSTNSTPLPPSSASSTPLPPSSERSTPLPSTDYISDRANVYDGDSFDVFRNNNIDVDKVHYGKTKLKLNHWKDEMTELDRVREMYKKYGMGDYDEEEEEEELMGKSCNIHVCVYIRHLQAYKYIILFFDHIPLFIQGEKDLM